MEDLLQWVWLDAVTGHKAYRTVAILNWLMTHEIETVIPDRYNESGPKSYV